ncbi:putative glycerophosphodiester phosphodiesterase, protein kinase RLK-Pelle-LRK10L-2 family [Helianthus annuus]|nr:putative glycerophosphodiester phosphodiesterase, protein kinase RLK-Pelle-LRK10L-2 family [Helianthus annuus]
MLAPGPDGPEVNYTNIFSLINSYFGISFQLSPSCIECQRIGGQCYARYGIFQCLDAKQALGVGSVTILITMVLCFRRKVRWRTKSKNNVNVEIFLKNHEFIAPKRYSYSQVQKMTNSFEVKLGQGGFGSVYKGAISDQNLVAVKVLNELKGDGEDFINEVASVGSTSHVNIVSLVGYCLEGRRKALIYEFMPNGSLERFIYGRGSSSNSDLGWEKLHQIAIGIARGLEYLHTGCNTRILHLDIKPHNILLDQEFCPKISDFGLAKLFPNERSMISMSRMRGTPGYIAPELFSRTFGQVSHKSDVYSYGMLILEMVGGRRNIEVEVDHTSEIYFPHWIYKKIASQEEELGLHEIVNTEENETIRKMIIVGLWCIQTNPFSRPTISKVLEMLEDNIASLEIPPKPYIFSPSRSVASSSTGQLSH